MKIFFDNVDLVQRLVSLLAEEGIGVENLVWGTDGEGLPTLEVALGDLPDANQKPLRVEVAELKERVDALESRPIVVKETVTPTVDSETDEQPAKKRGRPPNPVKNITPPVVLTGRMAKAAREMEQEQKIIGHPLGANFKVGERPLAANEFREFPKS